MRALGSHFSQGLNMGWDPIGDIKKAAKNVSKEINKGVSNITKEVSKGASNVYNETAKTIQDVGVISGNIGTIVGGDVGKVINSVANPFGGQLAAVGDLMKGDLNSATNRLAGAEAQRAFGVATVSSSVQKSLQGNTLKSVTMGMTDDWVNASLSGRYMSNTGDARAEDWKNITQAGVKTAAAAGLVYGAGLGVQAYGGAGAVGSAVAGGTTAAVTGAVKTAATGYVAKELGNAVNGGKTPAAQTPASAAPTAENKATSTAVVVGAGALVLLSLLV